MNETVFIITALVDLMFVLTCFALGRYWLQASIVVNLILISTFGAKLISVLGLVTNAGNVFYAAVFFAAHLLVEHYGKKEGLKSIWLGFGSLMFFVFIGQLTVRFIGLPQSDVSNQAMATLFQFVPRIATASILAYLASQLWNVWLYGFLYKKSAGKRLWFRDLSANVTGQLIDSVIFFSIAFLGVVPSNILLQTIVIGFAVKVLVGALGAPLLYASYFIKSKFWQVKIDLTEAQPIQSLKAISGIPSGWKDLLFRVAVFSLVFVPVLAISVFSYISIQHILSGLGLSGGAAAIIGEQLLFSYGIILLGASVTAYILVYMMVSLKRSKHVVESKVLELTKEKDNRNSPR